MEREFEVDVKRRPLPHVDDPDLQVEPSDSDEIEGERGRSVLLAGQRASLTAPKASAVAQTVTTTRTDHDEDCRRDDLRVACGDVERGGQGENGRGRKGP